MLFSMTLFAQAPTSFQYGVRTPTLFPWNGTNKIDVNGRLKLNTTAGGFIPAAMTTTQRNAISSPQTGESVYDVTLGKYYHWDGAAWVVSGGGTSSGLQATLAVDNKTNDIPITSNDETASIGIGNTGNILLLSTASGTKSLQILDDTYSFASNVRYLFQGNGIDMQTSSDGFGLPRLTTTQMNAIAFPTEGMLVRNTTESSIYQYNGTAWEALGSAAPTLPEFQIPFGQVGDVFGSDSTLTYEGGTLSINGVDALTTDNGQPLDSDLSDISSLAPPNDNILQRKAGVWTSRTPAQLKTDLALVKGDVGLGNVDNTTDLNKPVSTATQTALDLKANLASPTFTGTVAGITKSMVGLGNVDNTSDVNKPVSTAVATEYNSASALTFSGPIDLSKKGGSYYAEHTQTGAITFSVSATTVGGLAQVTILANGNAINLVGGWINVGGEPVSTTNGTTNYMVIWQTNNKVFYSVKVY